ncbi:MAG: DUF389 domain-containing protein, partial [Anaerolineales bacterium]
LLRASAEPLAGLLGLQANATLIALGIFAFLTLVQLFQVLPQSIRRPSLIAGLSVLLAGAVLSVLPWISIAAYRNVPLVAADESYPLGEFLRAVAWLMGGYAGFELVLASRRQIEGSGQRLPPALSSTLGIGTVFLVGVLLVTVGLPVSLPENAGTLTGKLTAFSFFPAWLIQLTAFLALLLAANGALVAAIRQIHIFSRIGAFPQQLRRTYRRVPMPVGLFASLALLTTPLLILSPLWQLVELAASMFLVTMTALNAAAIYSRVKEPDRRRALVLPFYPLIPAIGIGINLVLFLALPVGVLLHTAIWLGAGAIFYFVYARGRQTAAQEGEVVFGRVQSRTKRHDYRILVPIGEGDERQLVLSIAISLARQMNGELIPLQIIPVADPLAIEEGRRIARERNTLFRWSTRTAKKVGVPTFPITRLARSIPEGIIDTANEEYCDLILLSWDVVDRTRGHGSRERTRSPLTTGLGSVLDSVIRRAPCDLAVLAYRPENTRLHQRTGAPAFQARRVLVPTAGGPHAPLATRLALLLTREHDAAVQAVYVVPKDAAPEDIAEGDTRIQQTFAAMREQEAGLSSRPKSSRPKSSRPRSSRPRSSRAGEGSKLGEAPFEGQVVPAGSVVEGITQAGLGCDLILIGATEESLIDQVLFGNIPEQVARQSKTPVLMVKRFRGLRRFWLQRIWNALYTMLPKVSPRQQASVYRRLQRSALPSVDYFVLMGLSTLIATFGLLQNSTAVIIGAMLVAPLFTPLMALSMSIVQGDVRLLRLGIESRLKGVAAASGLAMFITAISPVTPITGEIAARTEPNILDLGVALAAGIVGAYAVARKEVAAALPGVAIAAALVPPLGVIGIGLGVGDLRIAGGAGLLVATNLIAIALAGALTLLLLGFRPVGGGNRATLRKGLFTALVLFLLITTSLVGVSVRSFRISQTAKTIQDNLQIQLQTYPTLELANPEGIRIQTHEDRVEVTAPVYLYGEVPEGVAQALNEQLSEAVGKPVRVRLVTLSVIEGER